MNTLKSVLLLGLLTGLLLAAGAAVAGQRGMLTMLVVSMALNLGAWWFSDSMVLASTGARPLPEQGFEWLHDDVADIAQRAGIPKPRLFVMDRETSPNAFATGRNPERGVVAVTAGLLTQLDRRQIRGVLAHELGHIKNRDTLISSIAATLAGALTYLSYLFMFGGSRRDTNPLVALLIMIAAPFAALLIRMAISRTREFAADRRAAELTGDPDGLADALLQLSRGVERSPMHDPRAQAVHFIVNGFAGGLAGLFSTHPPIEERVARLRVLSASGGEQ